MKYAAPTWTIERDCGDVLYLVDSLGHRVAQFMTDSLQAAYVLRVLQEDRARLDASDESDDEGDDVSEGVSDGYR
jgi:hypothetical protein